jgi:exodeoxyribonuclease V alpha subunit
MATINKEQISGEVLRITYHDPNNAFTVAKLQVSNMTREVAIVGYMPLIQIGQYVKCRGRWEVDRRHGRQFSVQEFSYELPTAPASVEKLLSSGFLRGVGPVYGAKIAKKFGAATFSILDTQPERLLEIEGLGKKRAKQIIESWKSRTQIQELFAMLSNWGITQAQTVKIFNRWGNSALQTIRENPYQLAKEIRGIGFQLADKIAQNLGIDHLSDIRVDAAIEFFLWELSTEGHTCIPLDQFLPLAAEKLLIDQKHIEERATSLFKQGSLVVFTPSAENDGLYIALKPLFSYEQRIASNISRIASNPSLLRSINIEKALQWVQETLHMQFAPLQSKAIASALQNKLSVITGGPGTGKSTITRAIVTVTSKLTKKIILVAPTGRAAKRLQEMTGHYSQTIHRLLKFNPATKSFTYTRHNPFFCDLLIIDEASMIDTPLTCALFDAIPNHTRCIIIGDSDQLPSIGPGNVLYDIIKSKKVPTVQLTEIFRQARHSLIIKNAHKINSGEMPYLTQEKGDFRFLKREDPKEIRSTIVTLVTKELPEKHGFDPKKEIQVLSPMRRGECGIEMLNLDLQTCFLSGKKTGPYAIGDKVIQLKNNYQKDVFNGDIGFITSIDEALIIDFDGKSIVYESSDLDEIALAWAVSIHKFQGSECPCVIIPIHTQHFKLLNKNLLYTAVTRGKKLVILVGIPKAIAIACHTTNKQERCTNLCPAIINQYKS